MLYQSIFTFTFSRRFYPKRLTVHSGYTFFLSVCVFPGNIKCKVVWKEKNWVGKCAQATGMTTSLRILSSKAYSNTCERFTRSELKLESVHQESPRSDIFRKRATKPHLKQKHCQKHLTWAKEKNNWTIAQWSKVRISNKSTFCFSFGNQGLETVGRLERHRIQAV